MGSAALGKENAYNSLESPCGFGTLSAQSKSPVRGSQRCEDLPPTHLSLQLSLQFEQGCTSGPQTPCSAPSVARGVTLLTLPARKFRM